jgi:hypothetical protein
MQLHKVYGIANVSYFEAMATEARYVSANLTPDAAAGIRSLTAAMTIEKGKRVTTSDLVLALVYLGQQHQDELIAKIKEG